jgi:hypothetical protein
VAALEADPSEPTGWTTQERTLAATAGVIALLIATLLGVAILPRGEGESAAADVSPTVAPRISETSVPASAVTSPVPTARSHPIPTTGFNADGLAELASYRFAVRMEGSGANSPLTPIEGTVEVSGIVTTDPEAIDIVIGNLFGPNSSVRIVAIGSDAWVDHGTGTLIAVPAEESDSVSRAVETYQPRNLFARSIGELPSDAIFVGTTSRAGVTVDEYRIDQTAVEGTGTAGVLMEGSFAIHGELGVPVWVDVLFTSADDPTGTFRISTEFLDLNGPSIQVVHP